MYESLIGMEDSESETGEGFEEERGSDRRHTRSTSGATRSLNQSELLGWGKVSAS